MLLRGEQKQTDASSNLKGQGEHSRPRDSCWGKKVDLLASTRVFSQDGSQILCEERGELGY